MVTRSTLKTACISLLLAGISYGGYAQYCTPDPGGSGCSDGDDINTFVLYGESGTSINDQNTGCSGDGAYDDRTAESVSLAQTVIYSAIVSSEYYYEPDDADLAGVWIDFNDNQQFESSELVGNAPYIEDGSGSNLNIAIPDDAMTGEHRMRVAVIYMYDDFGDLIDINSVDPCNTDGASWEYGEVHDYTVNIVPPPVCLAPQNVGIYITNVSAQVSWTGTGTYIVEYGPAGYTPGTTNTAGTGGILVSSNASSPVTINGLSSSTTYDVYVRQNCTASSDGYSSNSLKEFTTLAQAPPVNDMPSGAITVNVDASCAGPYTNENAAAVPGEPGAECSGIGANSATVWFKFTAPSSGAVKISTDYTGYSLQDSRIALFQVGDPTDYSTFESLACDEDNGIETDDNGNSYLSILYAAGLTPGVTYYIVVDKYSESDNEGDFCLTVNTLTDDMLSDGGDCESTYGNGTSESYHGWLSLVDDEGKLISNVRVPAGDFQDYSVAPSITVHTGAVREDANGLPYLDRNTYYDSYAEDEDFNEIDPAYDLQLFFKQSELDALSADLSTLNVTHAPGNACTGDFDGDGTQTALLTTAYGSSNDADWIQVSTPGFSNFFIMSGTTPLPIELKSITAKNAGDYNIINWSTTRSDAGDYFELERSSNGKDFTKIATINSIPTQFDYSYYDRSPVTGVNYYRLKLATASGRYGYSKTVTATVDKKYAFSIQAVPNPFSGILNVKINGAGDGKITITDITGKVIRTIAVTNPELQIDMSGITSGTYFLKYYDDANRETLKIVKD